MVKFQFRNLKVIEIEVDSILVLRIQVETDRPSQVITALRPRNLFVKFLPLSREGNITNALPVHIVRRILMVHLGICISSLRSLVTEMNLQQFSSLQLSWSLNPELVVP